MLRRKMPDTVILTGRPDAVSNLLARAAAARVPGLGEDRSLQVAHRGKSLKLALARVGQPGPAADLVADLARVARAERLNVAMEPNCVTGNPYSQQLNPWDWELDPWDWELDPWDWELDPAVPLVVPAGATPAEGETLFWQQLAFRQVGLTDAAGHRTAALAAHLGAGVLVGLFDALPKVALAEQPWLTVHPAAAPVQSPQDEGGRDISDHGLLCASLVHAMAPAAQVHLYEVCAADGFGTLFPLLEALTAFVAMAEGRPAIINLSLGTLCGAGPSPAMQAVLQKATDLGMVVCAAAGNKAKASTKVSTVPAAQAPASLPNVIAVSAASGVGCRATYSQRGDIGAPGGEDLGSPGPDDAEDIIGLGQSPSGYVRMDAGTSFATPLVAGAAALVLEDRLARGGALGTDTYAQVLAALKAGCQAPAGPGSETLANTGLGAGILSLQGLLA
jgi:hypothetical protein